MIKAAFLGLIQGLTEFLPVSSSGHLVFFQYFLSTNFSASFDIFVHTGTLAATVVYFYPQLKSLSKSYFKNIVIGSIPAVFVGIFFKTQALNLFSNPKIVVLGFTITTILLITSKKSGEKSEISSKNAFIIGLAQAFAIIPGLSRSGSTITTALNQNIRQKEAFAFSFLLSIPSVFGASLLNFTDFSWNSENLPLYLLGFLAAALSGYIALIILEKIMQKAQLKNFAYYTALMAVLTFLLT